MTGETHALCGICVGFAYAAILEPSTFVALSVVGLSALGSLLPDIDTCTSKAGSKIKPISMVISKLFGHRKLLHSPLLYLLLSILLTNHFPQFQVCWTALFLGIMSHLLLDMFNPKGIPLLYPYPKRYRLARVRCGSRAEKVIRAMFMLGVLLWVGMFSVQGKITLHGV